jgi:endonuclease I
LRNKTDSIFGVILKGRQKQSTFFIFTKRKDQEFNMRRQFCGLIMVITIAGLSLAAPPNGYYDDAYGKEGNVLRQALHDIIDNHTVASYSALWTHVQNTDKKSNGKVWDIYSDTPGSTPPYEYTFVTDQCGDYDSEGDCYNREHSWPQSWFNEASPMKTDLFHIYPTDGYVNGRRANYPFGEVNNPTWTSQNGSKVGPNVSAGYSGTVFEPIDAYKGDLARSFFYMSARYYGEDSTWDITDMTSRADIKSWALELLMSWHENDPVSEKESDRNEAIYGIQNNRNPFIDHPELAAMVFMGAPASPANFSVQSPTPYSVTLVWEDKSSLEDGYYIYVNGAKQDSTPANYNSKLVEGLSPESSYQFALRAYNENGLSLELTADGSTTAAEDSAGIATELIISEYVEGSSYNKALELYNGTGSAVNLSDYELRKQTNGAGDFGSVFFPLGILNSGETFIIVNGQASDELKALADTITGSGIITFNGNDAVALFKGGAMLDLVGIVDQISNWGADMTLVRKSSVTAPSAVFDFADWDQYPQNTFEYLGAHEMTDESLAVQLMTFSAYPDKNRVILNWSSATESANSGYIIFRQTGNGPMEKISSWQENTTLQGARFSSQTIHYRFIDKNVSPGLSYSYLLASEDLSGQTLRHWQMRQTVTLAPEEMANPADNIILHPVSPNPFNSAAVIRYTLQESAHITMQVWSVNGHLQKEFPGENQSAGNYSLSLDANSWPSGLYLIRIVGKQKSFTQKALLLK